MRVTIKKIIIGLVLASLSTCTAETPNPPVNPKITSSLPPTLVFIFLDKTGSATSSKIPDAKSTDFQSLIGKVKRGDLFLSETNRNQRLVTISHMKVTTAYTPMTDPQNTALDLIVSINPMMTTKIMVAF